MQEETYHALALFSGGLDSILAAKVIQNQGLRVKCLHYVSPFFGFPEKIEEWQEIYGLDIEAIDIGEEYAHMLTHYPSHGFGSNLNPCVNCKILMMQKTKALLAHYGAQFIVSGEVIGQRPMSQRRDTLNVIKRDADIKDILLRPLCAKHLDPTSAELEGLVKRELLYSFSGRGRTGQLELAKELGIKDIPSPAGGCKLTEKDTSARYWQVMSYHDPLSENFDLANIGRQFWDEESKAWLIIGRNQEDNQALEERKQENDILLRVNNFPSPLGLMRPRKSKEKDKCPSCLSEEIIKKAAVLLASYSPKAVKFSNNISEVEVILTFIKEEAKEKKLSLYSIPQRESTFLEPDWNKAQIGLKSLKKEMTQKK